jgi:acyl-CoA synthetase (AMP-forming)/AMP-acid ligase II
MKNKNPKRLTIEDVEIGKNYVLIVSTNAGLWAYNTGDTIKFVSLTPARIMVSGRYKHFISAFGEHVIGSEVEKALESALEQSLLKVKEFTVAPMVSPKEGLPFHEWWIEFDNNPKRQQIKDFEKKLDDSLQQINTYYKDLVQGKVLKNLEIVVVISGGFRNYMESKGKLGGQNKLPRLSNNRNIVENLTGFKI